MSFSIKTMNKISPTGLSLFGDKYDISEDHTAPEAIVVRSAKVNTNEFDNLLAVGRAGAGTNNVTVAEAADKGICVFNAPGANANAVSELVFSALGMAARNMHKALEFAASLKGMTDDAALNKEVEGKKSSFRGYEIVGRKIAIIGLGKIGVLVANAAVARGMEVVAYEPFPNFANMHMLHSSVKYVSELSEALNGVQFVSAHVPLLDATKGLLNKESLSAAADGAVVLNFARGPIVNDNDILELLDSGKISQYVNDFPSNKLLNHEKCICLPHLGASTGEAEENCATMVVEQLKDYLEYGVVNNSVNFPTVLGHPAAGVKTRLVVINRDVPHMIADITKILGDAGLNISSLKNESNGNIGYNLIDLATDVAAEIFSSIEANDNVLKVRVLNF
jgi:D-3-phosphoglycerate dehydrogenase